MGLRAELYREQRAWSDKFIPQIKRIVGPYLLGVADDCRDMHEATDLIVIQAKDLRIAARMRKPGYADKYPYDFTIRADVPSGTRTELQKMVDGFGDLFFYGHANEADQIVRWMLLDLDAWRAHLLREAVIIKNNGLYTAEKSSKLADVRTNIDGTKFVAFDVRNFVGPPKVLVSSSLIEANGKGDVAA
jgi:hypothetical protein